MKRTQQRCSTKCRREPLRPIENNPVEGCRRSAMLASDYSSEKPVEPKSVDDSQERQRSLRLFNYGKNEDKGELGSMIATPTRRLKKCQRDGLIDFGDSSKRKEEGNVDLGLVGAVQRSQKVTFVDSKNVLGKENAGIYGNPKEIEYKSNSDLRKCTVNKETQQRCLTKCQKKPGKDVVDYAKVRGKDNAGSDGLDGKMGECGGEKGKKRKIVGECEKKFESKKVGIEETCGFGWTEEQEVALQRAYLAAKPSTHFWKKVSKMDVIISRHKSYDCGEKGKKRKIVGECEKKFESKKVGIEETCGFGWTEEQEVALQRAYLAAKPSTHFWKKVSKMVPGKSAQECFDKVNGSFVTPPQPPPRSRTNNSKLSPIGSFSLLGSKSTQPAISFYNKMSRRSKTLVAQKTVRHLLRKHSVNDQRHEADHFSVLETSQTAPAMDFPDKSSPLSPDCISSPPGFLQNCSWGSSSANWKLLSTSKPADKENLESPEVLKRIKNMALHENYINQLHKRETKRKYVAASSSAFRACESEVDVKTDVLKVARSALISKAKEVISQFQLMQANIQGETDFYDEDDDCDDHNDNDDDEDAEC